MDAFERIRVIGRGAFGIVHLCRRKSDNRAVVVKQIPVDQLSASDRQATLTEVKVLAMLHHPNVIEYHSSGINHDGMMIVMEYAAGGNLYDFIEETRAVGAHIPESRVQRLFAQIASPLHYVHSRNVLHRDLKTHNIFLTKDRESVKIGDFGISKVLASKSKALTVIGTPCYISPELCEGKPYDQKSDVWALGCVLYEMCCLKRAFEAPSLPALVMKIMRGAFGPLPPALYSPELRRLVDSLLETRPTSRPSLVQILAHPWVAPAVYTLPPTLGVLPCSKEDVDVSRSISPFTATSPKSASIRIIGLNLSKKFEEEAIFKLPRFSSTEETLRTINASSSNRVVATTSEGKVVEWRTKNSPRFVDGLSGIAVVSAACFNDDVLFLITDRGILLEKMSSERRPRIVESLLGEEVVNVAVGRNHVCAATSDNDVFVWTPRQGDKEMRRLPKIDGGGRVIERVSLASSDADEVGFVLTALTDEGKIWLFVEEDWRSLEDDSTSFVVSTASSDLVVGLSNKGRVGLFPLKDSQKKECEGTFDRISSSSFGVIAVDDRNNFFRLLCPASSSSSRPEKLRTLKQSGKQRLVDFSLANDGFVAALFDDAY